LLSYYKTYELNKVARPRVYNNPFLWLEALLAFVNAADIFIRANDGNLL